MHANYANIFSIRSYKDCILYIVYSFRPYKGSMNIYSGPVLGNPVLPTNAVANVRCSKTFAHADNRMDYLKHCKFTPADHCPSGYLQLDCAPNKNIADRYFESKSLHFLLSNYKKLHKNVS